LLLRLTLKGMMTSAPMTDRDRLSRVTIANSLANLVRAASGSFENIVLPVVLIAVLSRTDYSNWALVFSIAAYITYLDFGLQTATQALVSRALANEDEANAARVARSALRVYFIVAVAALVLAALAAQTLAWIFPDIPDRAVHEVGATLLVLAAGQAANLGVNVIAGFYAGAHRSHVTAYSIALARCVSLLLSLAAAFSGLNILIVAVGYSVPLVITFIGVLVKLLGETRSSRWTTAPGDDVRSFKVNARTLLVFSGPLVLWNICSIFVGAVGTAIVGRVDYDALPYFSIAMMLTVAITGIANALLQPFLTNIGLSAKSASPSERTGAVVAALRLNGGILLLLITGGMGGFVVMGRLGLIADDSAALLTTSMIVAATGLRLAMTPFNMAFLASDDHRRIIAQPIIEAAVAVVGGVVLGGIFGAVGVGIASLGSALIAVMMLLFWSLRGSAWFPLLNVPSAIRALAPAAGCTALVLVADVVLGSLRTPLVETLLIEVVLVLASAMLAYRSAPRDARALILKIVLRRTVHRKR
jgi:O-antigen/teichoic acid export membrane protein